MVPLTLMHARVIGLMTMIDAGDPDHKIIAVATKDPEFNGYHEAGELPPHARDMLGNASIAGGQSTVSVRPCAS